MHRSVVTPLPTLLPVVVSPLPRACWLLHAGVGDEAPARRVQRLRVTSSKWAQEKRNRKVIPIKVACRRSAKVPERSNQQQGRLTDPSSRPPHRGEAALHGAAEHPPGGTRAALEVDRSLVAPGKSTAAAAGGWPLTNERSWGGHSLDVGDCTRRGVTVRDRRRGRRGSGAGGLVASRHGRPRRRTLSGGPRSGPILDRFTPARVSSIP